MFEIKFSDKARGFLKKAEHDIAGRIINKIEVLKDNPVPSDAKFIGRDNSDMLFRYRIGDYRVLYKALKNKGIILITKIDKRGRVYKK